MIKNKKKFNGIKFIEVTHKILQVKFNLILISKMNTLILLNGMNKEQTLSSLINNSYNKLCYQNILNMPNIQVF